MTDEQLAIRAKCPVWAVRALKQYHFTPDSWTEEDVRTIHMQPSHPSEPHTVVLAFHHVNGRLFMRSVMLSSSGVIRTSLVRPRSSCGDRIPRTGCRPVVVRQRDAEALAKLVTGNAQEAVLILA
ncbi:hypothetical protein IT415_00045 [bacterium]|nr:hypothetical protein [bacterium]